MSEATRGWCVQVRRCDLEAWELAPLDRTDFDAVFRSEADAERYADSVYGPNGVSVEWRVVPFTFHSGERK